LDLQRLHELRELRSTILHSGEALSMSAGMAGATGDLLWEERYRANESALREAVERASQLSERAGDQLPVAARDGAEIALGRIDAYSRELSQSPFPAAAYAEMKEKYDKGVRKIDQHLERISQSTLNAAAAEGLHQGLLLLGLIPALIGAWIYMLRALHSNHQQFVSHQHHLLEASEERDQFLSRMSHSIRSPLTSVLGYTDLLMDTDPPREERDEYLGVIRRNGENVLTILGDLLDLYQLKSRKVAFERIEICPFDILYEVSRFTREQVEERSLEFVTECEGKIPSKIETDLERVRQILVTLVSNAIQFTESGRIRIGIRLVPVENSDRHLLEFKVTDTGRGMTSQQADRAFDAYSGGGKDPRSRTGGTGLGLAIARELARGLGGDLTLESSLGQGTSVTFTIDVGTLERVPLIEAPEGFQPRERGPAPPKPAKSTKPAEFELITGLSGRLLLAEDTADVRAFLESVLRKAGLEVETAEDGEVAFEKAIAAWEMGQPFDAVLMDMQMPVLNGFDATAKLRGKGYQGPIIAITSHALKGDRELCIEAGCDAYTTKPIDRQHLLRTIAEHLNKAAV
jgi:signal transduction histidine kinase/CheY-like chemotaxis protein